MKKYHSLIFIIPIAVFTLFTACQKEDELTFENISNEEELDARSNQNSPVYPPNSHPFHKSYAAWTVTWWQWLMSFDCASSPLNDPTGANGGAGQSGPVYFLVGTTGGSAVRNVTIGKDKAILFPLINTINDYPCPDPNFQPPAGQSLEDFLLEGAASFINLTENLSITLDGKDLGNEGDGDMGDDDGDDDDEDDGINLLDYRFPTELFNFTGNPDLINCLDPCVTGTSQVAVSDGYWIMLKKLKKGKHVLHFHAEVPIYGFVVDVRYNIKVK